MASRSTYTLLVAVLFAVGLLVALITHGTGVVRDDPDSNIAIPDELTIPLELQVAYNDSDIYFRYRWPAERPHLFHDMLRYTDGEWVRHGRSPVGSDPDGVYEDRVTMLVDDGSVPEFQRYGGYITVGSGMRFFTEGEASSDDVSAHPHLGEELGASDVRKYLPATRSDPGDWATVFDQETLADQRAAGYFLDLWHWRAHRSNPLDASDDQHVAEYRFGDSGTGPYFTNWDGEAGHPELMFDPDETGVRALNWDDVIAGTDDFDSLYYLAEEVAVPFDPDHDWQEGDTIPRRVLREPAGSRGAIAVHREGRWTDGQWDVTLRRAKDTGYPDEDKIFHNQGVYDLGIAVHRDATGSRWHYVSLPLQVGLGRAADVVATRFTGDEPDWTEAPTTEVTLFYPGQVSWPRLTNEVHAGAGDIAQGVPVKFRHTEAQLAQYGVEMEFDGPIRTQWWLTLIVGVLLIVSFGVALNYLLGRKEG